MLFGKMRLGGLAVVPQVPHSMPSRHHHGPVNLGRGIWLMIPAQPTAEARKAEGASWIVLLTPSPPDSMGRDA